MRHSTNYIIFTLIVSSAFPCWGFSLPKVHLGSCPQVSVQQNFDPSLYMGMWYEQAGYNTAWVEGGDSRCVAAEYSLNATKGVVNVHNMAIDNNGNKKVGIKGTAVLDDPNNKEAKLTVTFNIGWYGDVNGMYWVLQTDYKTYSVVYSCRNLLLLHSYTIWFLGREQVFNNEESKNRFFNAANGVLRAQHLDPTILAPSKQVNCTV